VNMVEVGQINATVSGDSGSLTTIRYGHDSCHGMSKESNVMSRKDKETRRLELMLRSVEHVDSISALFLTTC